MAFPVTPRTKNSRQPMKIVEFTKLITPDGAIFDFIKATNRYAFADQGYGLPAINWFTQSGPFQHGSTVRGYTYGNRIIQHTFVDSEAENQDEYWEARSVLLDFLRQNRQNPGSFDPFVLRKIRIDGSIRDICVFVDQGPVLAQPGIDQWDNYTIKDPIRFVAFNPFYFNPISITENMVFGAVTGLVFPISAPISFGGSGAETDTITYLGTVFTNPTIQIKGPARNPDIRNLTTDQIIRFTYSIAAGETVVITTGIGNFSLTSSVAGDISGTIDIETDPLFNLVPHPTAPNGVNSLSISMGAATAASEVAFTYFTRYIGI